MTGHDNGVITIALSEAGDIERGAGCRWENLTGPFSATSDMKWATIIGTCWCAIEGSWMLLGKFLATIRWITARLYAATTRKGRPQPGRRATSPPMRRLTPGGFCRDLCALSPYRRHAGDGGQFRHADRPGRRPHRRSAREGRIWPPMRSRTSTP